jgi:hypothetical protein
MEESRMEQQAARQRQIMRDQQMDAQRRLSPPPMVDRDFFQPSQR